MSSSPFFIVGSGRSGSTLLRVMLSAHPRISIPPETRFFLSLLQLLPHHRPLTAAEVGQAADIILSDYRWPDMDMEEDDFRRRLAELRQPRLRDVAEIVYREHVVREGSARWGDKTPPYVEIVPQLAALFPEALFIHIFRDGRDVAKSLQRRGWFGGWLHDNAGAWNRAIRSMEGHARLLPANRLLELRYESLVLNPEQTLRHVCQFLSEDYDPSMLNWRATLDRRIPSREAHIHLKLRRLPEPGDVGRWRVEMTPREIFVCEALMGKRLEGRGYPRRYTSAWCRPLLTVTRWYCRFILPLASVPARFVDFAKRKIVRARNAYLQNTADA